MSIAPITVLPSSLLRKLFVKCSIFIPVQTGVVQSPFLPNLSTGIFIITILNNLLQLEDYFPKKAISMRRDINDRKTPHRFVGLVRYCKILATLDMQSAH